MENAREGKVWGEEGLEPPIGLRAAERRENTKRNRGSSLIKRSH